MTINEHWGQVGSEWPGGLWWENSQLKRKNMLAGWGNKKATEWKPAHELLQISLAAHVKDGFRLHCGSSNLETWANTATLEDFESAMETVMMELFSTAAVEKLESLPDDERDATFENNVLQNRDTLFYLELVTAIKKGDIGRVVNVLRVWMVMMRTPKTMPKYADTIFETLNRVKTYPGRMQYIQ